MKNQYCLFTLLLLAGQTTAQLTSMDIRRADGKGPYPFYLTTHISYCNNNKLFDQFTDDYRVFYGIEDKEKAFLRGIEVNAGVVINDQNLLGIKGIAIRGMAIEMGYRFLERNISQEYELTDQVKATRRLLYQTATYSLRFCYRMPAPGINYPFTLQVQAGPTLYNFYTVRGSENDNTYTKSERHGYGIFEDSKDMRRIVSGIDTRMKILLFDPAGTAGGIGFYIEYSYLWTFGNRDLSPLYDTFLGYQKHVDENWDYGSLTAGVVVPLAIRMVSSE